MQRNIYSVLNFVQSQNDIEDKTKHQQNEPSPNPFFRNWKFWVIIAVLISTAIIASLKFEDVVEYGKSGEPRLKPDRTRKLEDTVRYYDGAEQYALVARVSKYYPCPSCVDGDSIFLFTGEVWKYGVTINGQAGRYSGGLPDADLQYVMQIQSSLPRCLSAEKTKIINYPLLPENLKRKGEDKLARPPGNPHDL